MSIFECSTNILISRNLQQICIRFFFKMLHKNEYLNKLESVHFQQSQFLFSLLLFNNIIKLLLSL